MKIGFDAKRAFYNTTGLGNYSRGVINCLERYKPSIEACLFSPKHNSTSLLKNDEIETVFLEGKLKNTQRVFGLNKLLHQKKIDIYHGLSNEIPWAIKGIKTAVTIHDLIFLKFPEFYSFFDRKIYWLKTKHAIAKSDLIITTSQQTANDIDYYFGKGKKCLTIYQHLNKKNEILENVILPEIPLLLYISSFEQRKNHIKLISAFASIAHTIPHHLVLIGRPRNTTELIKQKIKDLNLENRVIMIENASLKTINKYLNMASGFIYPSLYEGFGIPLLEALAYNLPIACSDLGVFKEIGQSSIDYFNPNDEKKMAECIIELTKKKEMSYFTEKYAPILQNFTAQKHAEALHKAYLNLL